jgi:hypothetical protein
MSEKKLYSIREKSVDGIGVIEAGSIGDLIQGVIDVTKSPDYEIIVESVGDTGFCFVAEFKPVEEAPEPIIEE